MQLGGLRRGDLMAFRFRYEALLSYRRHRKEMAELELSQCLKRINEVEATIKELNQLYHHTARTLGELMKRGVDGRQIQNYGEFLVALDQEVAEQIQKKAGYEAEAEEKRALLLERHKELKVLESLKEREKVKWLMDQARQEQKELSELSIMRYGREFL